MEPQVSLEIELAETGAKIRVGEEDFLWDAETENLADGYKNGLERFLYRTLSKVTGQNSHGEPYRHPCHEDRLRYAG